MRWIVRLFIGKLVLGGAWAAPAVLESGNITTPAASAELAAICPDGVGFPADFIWASGNIIAGTQPAAGGTPLIEQYRGGALIASYTSFANQAGCTYLGNGQDVLTPGPAASSGCGAFTRVGAYRLAIPGDTLLVYPAVYSGAANQPWFGPMWDSAADYTAGIFHNPDDVTVMGVVQNGRRPVIELVGGAADNTLDQAPVYFQAGSGMLMENIDVIAAPHSYAGRAGIYINGVMNLTLRNMRVAWFQRGGVNGVFATGNGSGTLTLDGVELDHNGGPNGPAHNIYVNASVVDPLYGVVMTRSWSHDAFYGHLFKSRAQSTSLIGDYFRGGLPQPGKNVAESYLIDISNGGILDLRDSILTKTQSGALSNATMIDFGGEGIVDSRTQSVDIENNDFVAFSATNGGGAALTPMGFFSPRVVPGGTGWPIGVATQIIKNAFVGVCGSPYQGDISVNEAFSELSKTFALSTKIDSDEATLGTNFPGYVTVLGQPTYRQNTALGPVRIVPTIGAQN